MRFKLSHNLIIKIFLIVTACFYLSLSYFRSATADETIYLRETMMLTNAIHLREWFGNYAVGLHGFLFKIPVALVFLITGPSVFVATANTLVLALFSLYVFYNILYKHFYLRGWALAGVFFLATSFRFYSSTQTYLREIPVLLTVLLFIESVLSKRSRWLVGLILLFMFDAKEYVFFMASVSYITWSVLIAYFDLKTLGVKTVIKNTLITLTAGLGPSLCYLVLMIYTGLVPINMFNASILGFIDSGLKWNQANFSVQNSTSNLLDSDVKTIAQLPYLTPTVKETENLIVYPDSSNTATPPTEKRSKIQSENPINLALNNIIYVANIALSYLGKLLYPRTFSFLSVPKIILFPALAVSLYYLRYWFKGKSITLVLLPIFLLTYIFIFLIRTSHGRYIFPVSPLIYMFFVLFLKNGIKNIKLTFLVLFFSMLAFIGGMFFEEKYIIEKIILEVSMLFSMLSLLWSYKHRLKYIKRIQIGTVFIIGFFTLSVAIFYSYKTGQVSQYLKYGPNMECDKISTLVGAQKTWINDIGCGELPLFFRQDLGSNPEWHWKLANWVPKKRLLSKLGEPNTYNFSWKSGDSLLNQVEKNSIKHLILTRSNLSGYEFKDEEKLALLQSQKWLVQRNVYNFKNKTTYVFDVVLN